MAELKECARLVEGVAEQLDARCRTWKETLDRAYKDGWYNQNTGLWETDECKVSRARYTLDAYRDALSMVDTLGQQIDELNRRPAPENKALTLKELEQMDGEPVWCAIKEITKDDGFYGVIEIDCKRIYLHGSIDHVTICWDVVARKLRLYRHKPEEDVG